METIGPLQLRVMHFLWAQGPATVNTVQEHINKNAGNRPLAYTTILTVMRNLARRGFLSQTPQRRSHLFAPLIDERSYKLGMLRQMRHDLFSGRAEGLLSYLVQDEEIDSVLRERIDVMNRNGAHA
ncbi:MAG TPA: BlaI/MecI/CopY family transcriptional regulator [Planctomycetota bacterium]|nr:BlaI/MecI/CopY family transcriptional regulator [Planctomycetota bacterium]